ncbi:tRNA (adenosine(37)-N6)-threonylcarbamoyltransferase complex ATPase subunit type 1 TsaE [Candidatus Saccharibacteria bacterium]|nr:tRNA (adenosine(37)-N6)-threonylcarbamoyltransferase complex ATPase subunit type 1 TsaE [Candidatus Saccharibacteria bacterium]
MEEATLQTYNLDETIQLGKKLGENLRGGEVIELTSDLGGGKTSLVRGIAEGFGSVDPVSSPSFTICNTYSRSDGKQISHFDFYRLDNPGIVADELAEVIGDENVVTIVEWGATVHDVLPQNKILITISTESEDERTVTFKYTKDFIYVCKGIK